MNIYFTLGAITCEALTVNISCLFTDDDYYTINSSRKQLKY